MWTAWVHALSWSPLAAVHRASSKWISAGGHDRGGADQPEGFGLHMGGKAGVADAGVGTAGVDEVLLEGVAVPGARGVGVAQAVACAFGVGYRLAGFGGVTEGCVNAGLGCGSERVGG
ncbi:hypothetical protein GCM10020000_79370 [Streptomyces olivoverticillatus]